LAFTFPETGEGGSPIVFKARRMRLTHYEDGLLCGERFCINLIRHLFHLQASLWSFALQSSGTFSAVNIIQLYFENVLTPSPVSGKVKVRSPPIIRRNIHLNCSPLFLLEKKAQKKKLTKRKGPIRRFHSCGSDQGSAFGNRKLLKKFDQNFQPL